MLLSICTLFPTRRSSDLGTIEVMSLNRIDKNESYIENGITINNQVYGIIDDCITTIVIGSTVCSNGGKHRYGVPCTGKNARSEEHTSELQSRPHLVCRLL